MRPDARAARARRAGLECSRPAFIIASNVRPHHVRLQVAARLIEPGCRLQERCADRRDVPGSCGGPAGAEAAGSPSQALATTRTAPLTCCRRDEGGSDGDESRVAEQVERWDRNELSAEQFAQREDLDNPDTALARPRTRLPYCSRIGPQARLRLRRRRLHHTTRREGGAVDQPDAREWLGQRAALKRCARGLLHRTTSASKVQKSMSCASGIENQGGWITTWACIQIS